MCDLCDTWDGSVDVTYEFGRCLVPSRFMQLCKDRHMRTSRWAYVEGFYRDLYDVLYDDIKPSSMTATIHDRDAEDEVGPCEYSLSGTTRKLAMELIKTEARNRIQHNLMKQKQRISRPGKLADSGRREEREMRLRRETTAKR